MKSLLLVVACSGSLLGQQLTVPPGYSTSDAPSLGFLAGAVGTRRQQFVIDGAMLASIQGKLIDAVWFRRDAARNYALTGGQADIVVSMSTTNVRPENAGREFV